MCGYWSEAPFIWGMRVQMRGAQAAGDLINKWVLIEHELGFRIWIDLRDIAVSRAVMLNCYETVEIKFVKNHLRSGQFTLDIGANIGFFSMLIASVVGAQGRVIAFEPLPFLSNAAEKSRKENKFDHCTVHNTVLAAESGTATYVYAEDPAKWGSGFLSFDGSVLPNHNHKSVPIEPLKKFVGETKVDFVKIDMEGAEPVILGGALDYLKTHMPIILTGIQAARLSRVCKTTPRDYIRMMTDIGYECREITRDGFPGERIPEDQEIERTSAAFMPK